MAKRQGCGVRYGKVAEDAYITPIKNTFPQNRYEIVKQSGLVVYKPNLTQARDYVRANESDLVKVNPNIVPVTNNRFGMLTPVVKSIPVVKTLPNRVVITINGVTIDAVEGTTIVV